MCLYIDIRVTRLLQVLQPDIITTKHDIITYRDYAIFKQRLRSFNLRRLRLMLNYATKT